MNSLFNDYEGFVDKFKVKKTTDDCYTPDDVYDKALEFVRKNIDITGLRVARTFFPGRVPTRSSATRIGTLLNKHKITSVHRRGGAFYFMPPKIDSFARMEMSKSMGEESYEI